MSQTPNAERLSARTPDPIDWWAEERAARRRGYMLIAGIDEAGRGPLAGPVVAACVALPYECHHDGIRDSKTLSPQQRDRSYETIQKLALGIGVGVADVAIIDSINILRASHEAMRLALASISCSPDVALIDGLPVQPFPIPQIAIVKGDGRSASIAAASIIAKVTRDRLMEEYESQYPGYGFTAHKGYATREHVDALRSGPARFTAARLPRSCSPPCPSRDLRERKPGRAERQSRLPTCAR